MAILQVNAPQKREAPQVQEEKPDDTLQKINAALGIASSVFGIASNLKNMKTQDLQQKSMEQKIAESDKEAGVQANIDKGVYGDPEKQYLAGKGFHITNKPTADAFSRRLNTAAGTDGQPAPELYLTSKDDQSAYNELQKINSEAARAKSSALAEAVKEKNRTANSDPIEQALVKDFAKNQAGANKTKSALNEVDSAIDAQIKYSQETLAGTGPVATGLGLKKYFSKDTEALNAKLKSVNVKNMATTFGGMSKAVDSDAERRAWEGTQADITNDDETNMKILLGQKSILMKDAAEADAQKQWVSSGGKLKDYSSPIDGKVTTMISTDGEMKLIPKDQVDKAAENGYVPLDVYSREIVKSRGKISKSIDKKFTTPSADEQSLAQRLLQQRRLQMPASR